MVRVEGRNGRSGRRVSDVVESDEVSSSIVNEVKLGVSFARASARDEVDEGRDENSRLRGAKWLAEMLRCEDLGRVTHSRSAGSSSELLGHLDSRIRASEMQQERSGEVSASRVARNADLVLRNAHLVDEVVVSSQRLDELRGVFELWSELIVEAEDGELDLAFEVEILGQSEEEELSASGRVESAGRKGQPGLASTPLATYTNPPPA